MVEHTPGPWDFIKGDARWFVRAAGMDIASVGTVPYWENFKPVDEANARLIAAAPKLWDAAEMFSKWFDKNCGSSINSRWDRIPPIERAKIVKAFRAALAKAGE